MQSHSSAWISWICLLAGLTTFYLLVLQAQFSLRVNISLLFFPSFPLYMLVKQSTTILQSVVSLRRSYFLDQDGGTLQIFYLFKKLGIKILW